MKVIRTILAVIFNGWFWYCVIFGRFALLNTGDIITKWGLYLTVIALDVFFIADTIDRYGSNAPQDIAPRDPNESKDYLDRF